MFEKATRLKLMFPTPRGSVTVQDLWDMPLVATGKDSFSLDATARKVNAELGTAEEESFVAQKTQVSTLLTLKLDIVKHIIAYKLEAAQRREDAIKTDQHKDKIMRILARKKDAELEELSVEELQKMIG